METQQTIASIDTTAPGKTGQLRTRNKKKLFLEFYKRSLGSIILARTRAGIKSNKTVYNWQEKDPAFKVAMEDVVVDQQNLVEDKLMQAIFIDNKWWAIRFYLSRCHPAYMLRSRRIKDTEDVIEVLRLDRIYEGESLARCGDCGSKYIQVKILREKV